MPNVPLIDQAVPPCRDAWHRVIAPGGYEWWYFDAEDDSSQFRLVAILLEGFVFHPGYLRRYDAYLANPTRLTPPMPSDFPCAYMAVYENETLAAQFMTQVAPREFEASDQTLDVRVGPNFARATEGSVAIHMQGTPWHLTWRGPQLNAGQSLSADLNFKPVIAAPSIERRFLSREMTGADHHWVIARPLCGVSGNIQLPQPNGSGKTIEFSGKGYHDHNYGTAPIGPGVKCWIRGRTLQKDRAAAFHVAVPRDPAMAIERHLVMAEPGAIQERIVRNVFADFNRHTAWGLEYPSRLSLDDVVQLSRPRVVDGSPFHLRLAYDAIVEGEPGTAFCEAAYPQRLRWPVLGRMIERSIHHPNGSVK